MNSIPKTRISNSAKLVLILFVVFGAIRIVDFIFYGQQTRDLLAGIGFSLMAFGVYKNGFGKTAPDANGRYASIVGAGLVLAAIVMRFWR